MHPVILQKNANRDLRIYAQFNSWWQCHSEVRGYKGKTIAHDVVKTGNIGNPYSTEKKTISDYTFKEVQGNVSGHFSGQPQTVTYVYTHDPIPSGNIIVKYVDTRGQAAHDVVKIGKIGGSYLTEKKKSLVINLKKFKVILLVNLRLKLK